MPEAGSPSSCKGSRNFADDVDGRKRLDNDLGLMFWTIFVVDCEKIFSSLLYFEFNFIIREFNEVYS